MSRTFIFAVLTLALASLPTAFAASNGMDMSMDGAMNLTMGMMIPYLHFTPGDTLWFMGWVPTSGGAMFGACMGLFLLAIIDRWIVASRSVMETHWRKSAQLLVAKKTNNRLALRSESPALEKAGALDESTDELPTLRGSASKSPWAVLRSAPPFIASNDIPRGIIHTVQSALGFTFMLAAMTFQASFIISIVLGMGVGETLFGRFATHAHIH